jgi:hypothetical protein
MAVAYTNRVERSSPVLFPFGAEMLEWVRQGGRPNRVGKATQLAIRWHTFWFEHQLAAQRRLPTPATQLRRDPVLILGLWRSGTTSMHNMLARLQGMIAPAMWQCMNPAAVRLRPPRSTSERPMDPISSDALSPQEEELALLALGAPSVYRAFFDPRRLPQLARWLDENSWTGDAFSQWLTKWLEFSASVSAGRTGRLLLKSPAHTFRIRALTEALPQASYVWLTREPLATFFSNRKMWLSMFRRYALWNWSAGELDTFLLHAMEAATQSLEFAIGALPPDKLVIVEFDRLIRAPAATRKAIEARLSLTRTATPASPHRSSTLLAEDTATTTRQPDPNHAQALPPEASDTLERLRVAMQAAAASHGLQY